jgi:hypothetical protein
MNLMTSVATGGPQIDTVQADYFRHRRAIKALCKKYGFEDPNPYDDLWEWYGYWSRELGTYQSRRAYIRGLFKPLLEAINGYGEDQVGSDLSGADLEGWDQVESQVRLLGVRLSNCNASEDAQAIGLLCRDIMISLAQATYDPEFHDQVEGESAVNQLKAVIDYCAPGKSSRVLRKLTKATLDYANTVQHRRDGNVAEAGIVAEATVASVRLVRRLVNL